MTAPRALVYVQHLLGSGHLKRAALLANAMARAGLDVTLVSGGFAVPGLALEGVRFVQLPPVGAADLSFKSLVDGQGRPVDEALRQARRAALLALWQETDPQLLLVELFPFGRRQMRFELLPLLELARQATPRRLIVSSVRDVLGGGQSDPLRQQRMLALFDQYFDQLLVHGDPALVRFEQTFAHVPELAERLHYTGYVVNASLSGHHADDTDSEGWDEVLVSAGGGAVGQALFETAVRARPLSRLADLRWRVLVGAAIGEADFARLQALAWSINGPGMVVERNRSDFVQLLGRCRVSVSQAGYNTVMETLQSGTRSVMVPFAGGSETEQKLRARLLAERGWIEFLAESELSPESLARALDQAADREPPAKGSLRLDGADVSAKLLRGWLTQIQQ